MVHGPRIGSPALPGRLLRVPAPALAEYDGMFHGNLPPRATQRGAL